MAEETQYTVNLGLVTISTANSSRDGTGTITDVITGASNGTLIKDLTIKAQTNTTEGTIRLYLYDGITTGLWAEIPVPAVTKSSRDPSFETHFINLNLFLKSGYKLRASTEKAETFNVIATGLNITYYATSVRTDTTLFTVVNINGTGSFSTANSNLDGTGTINKMIQVGNPNNGAKIERIHIKATASTTPGMIRLYIQDNVGTVTKLFTEIPVPAVTPTATAPSFGFVVNFNDCFYLQPGYKIMVSTEKAEAFVAAVEGLNIKYLA